MCIQNISIYHIWHATFSKIQTILTTGSEILCIVAQEDMLNCYIRPIPWSRDHLATMTSANSGDQQILIEVLLLVFVWPVKERQHIGITLSVHPSVRPSVTKTQHWL